MHELALPWRLLPALSHAPGLGVWHRRSHGHHDLLRSIGDGRISMRNSMRNLHDSTFHHSYARSVAVKQSQTSHMLRLLTYSQLHDRPVLYHLH